MAAKKDKVVVSVNASEINLKDILTQGPEAGYVQMLAAMGIIKVKMEEVDQIVKPFDEASKFFKSIFEAADYNSVVKNLVANGVLESEDQQLVVKVTVPEEDGTEVVKDVSMKSKELQNFALNEKIYTDIDKKTLFTKFAPEVFDRYVKLEYNQKAMAEDLAAGTLPDIFADYCTISPTVKAATSITKGK